MATETRTTDKKARVSLPKAFADCTVLIEQVSERRSVSARRRSSRKTRSDSTRRSPEPLSRSATATCSSADLLENPPPPNEALRRCMGKRTSDIMDDWRDQARLTARTTGAASTAGRPPSMTSFARSPASTRSEGWAAPTSPFRPGEKKGVRLLHPRHGGHSHLSTCHPRSRRSCRSTRSRSSLLGRLAVDRAAQGKRLGRIPADGRPPAVAVAFRGRRDYYAVEVNAIDEQAKRFYEKYGFIPLARQRTSTCTCRSRLIEGWSEEDEALIVTVTAAPAARAPSPRRSRRGSRRPGTSRSASRGRRPAGTCASRRWAASIGLVPFQASSSRLP